MKRGKQYKQQSIVSGMGVTDILNMSQRQFNSLTESELRKVVGRLVSAGNKRIRNLESKTDRSSPAYIDVMRSGGKFSTRGKGKEELKAELLRAKQFMTSETSTARNWKRVQTHTIERIKKAVGDFSLTKNQWSDFWSAYKDLSELDPSARLDSVKYEIFKMISVAVEDKSMSSQEIAVKLQPEVQRIYERNQQTKNEFFDGGVSGYFSRR